MIIGIVDLRIWGYLSTARLGSATGPVRPGTRIELLDGLRGVALFGVLWANVLWFFSGYGELTSSEASQLATASMDGVALQFETFFVVGKFISIFSFLFGVGLALQLSRISGTPTEFGIMYRRRMTWLLVIGACHALLVWYGDILHLYAVLGLGLLVAARLPDRSLLTIGLFLALLGPAVIDVVLLGLPRLTDGTLDPAATFDARWTAASAHRDAFASGSYGEIVRANVADVWAWLTTDDALSTGVASFGKFILGLWVGRSGVLSRVGSAAGAAVSPNDRRVLLRVGTVGLCVGTTLQVAAMADVFGGGNDWLNVADALLWNAGVVGLAASYVCGMALGYTNSRGRRWLMWFAPVGRTALSSYMSQSIICILVFHSVGLGLYKQVGPVASFGVAAVIFSAQVALSALWLRYFRFGPAEWLWRSLSYRELQQFRASRAAA